MVLIVHFLNTLTSRILTLKFGSLSKKVLKARYKAFLNRNNQWTNKIQEIKADGIISMIT
jgi:hypothetical protein